MKNLYARNAKFEEVLSDPLALRFHSDRWDSGHRDRLAKECWQYLQHLRSQEVL